MLQFHVAVSLVAMLVSVWCIFEVLRGGFLRVGFWLFLGTHMLTSLTGFPLAPHGFDPPRAIGILLAVLLLVCAWAFYRRHDQGIWPVICVGSFFFASYLNFFVGVVQAFQKVPSLRTLAPQQTELPFVVAQLALLVGFVGLGWVATRRLNWKSGVRSVA